METPNLLETPPAPAPDGPVNNPSDTISASIQRASATAVREHGAENPAPRGRGRPRKTPPVRLEGMGAQPAPLLGAETISDPPPAQVEAYDEEAAGAIVDGVIEAMNDVAASIQRNHAMACTKSKEIADEAAKSARMSERAEKNIRFGAMACIKKYSVDMEYAPEAALGIPLVLWLVGNYIAYKRVSLPKPETSPFPPA